MQHHSSFLSDLEHSTTNTLAASQRRRGRLVILEANSLARSALARFFAPRYRYVEACDGSTAAENALSENVGTWTDLIVSGRLANAISGFFVVAGWRHRYPQLRRVVLATGSDVLPGDTSSIDAVFRKPFNVHELGLYLGS